jgi:hypothetical protein
MCVYMPVWRIRNCRDRDCGRTDCTYIHTCTHTYTHTHTHTHRGVGDIATGELGTAETGAVDGQTAYIHTYAHIRTRIHTQRSRRRREWRARDCRDRGCGRTDRGGGQAGGR